MRAVRRLLVGIITIGLALTTLVGTGGSAQAATSAAAKSLTVTVDASRASLTRIAGYGPDGGFKAVFKSPHRFKNRWVSLQKLVPVVPESEGQPEVPAHWVEVKRAKMNSKGEVKFTARPLDGVTYRAVADTHKYKVKKKKRTAAPVATASVVAVAPAPTVSYSFSAAHPDWEPRNNGLYGSGGRLCSAPFDNQVTYKDGKAVLRVTKADKTTTATVNAQVKQAQKAAGKKQEGCKYGSFRNAMISTQNSYWVKSGTISARVKFPLGQGMHASVWLQSGDTEIDVIETYGYGKGVTSTIHMGGKQYPLKESSRWVLKSAAKKKSWWSAYHTVTATWNPDKVTVWVDGSKVQEIKNPKPDASYFLVLSMLTSDWEVHRMTKPVKGAKGVKKTDLGSSKSRFYVDWLKVWAD